MATLNYYSTPSLWGKGMFITLKEIVEDYMSGLESDDYTYNVSRSNVLKQAKKAVREFNFSSVRNFEVLEFTLSPTLQVTLPENFVDYYKISWIDENGMLYDMAQNERISTASNVTQDGSGNFVANVTTYEIVTTDGTVPSVDSVVGVDTGRSADLGKVFNNGDFVINKEKGVIQFNSTAKSKKIVMAYYTDGYSGIADEDIKINKLAADAVSNFIYYRLIERNRNVPANEKARARKTLNISVRNMNSMINPIREEDFMQVLKSKSRWVKQQ